MTVAYENQFDLKHYTKADSNDIELALIGIEIMEEIQQMARQQNVHFSLDADDGISCENKKTESDITEFKNYIVYLNGDMKTYCDESGCYTEIVLQTYKAFNR